MRVACITVPRFAVEAERRRRRDTGSRLILIGEGTVLDCSLGAEVSRVRRGMRMSEAMGLCQRAVVLPPDMPYYERLFDEMLDLLEEFSPDVEPAGPGSAYVSLLGLSVEPVGFVDRIISLLHGRLGFMASAGVGGGKFVARVAAEISRPGSSKVVEQGSERQFLAPLPVQHLPLSGAMGWRLDMLGIASMGDIAAMPVGSFQAQFGPEGKRCWELAHGIDNEPVSPRVKEATIVHRLQLPAPASTLDPVFMAVERLIRAAYEDRERGGCWVRKAVVRGAFEDGGSWELPVVFREALANPGDAWFAVKSAITRRPPERPVEELEVELVGLSGESGKQATMFEGKGKLWRQVEETVRQLNAREGRKETQARLPLGKVVEVEPWSRIPERRSALADFDL